MALLVLIIKKTRLLHLPALKKNKNNSKLSRFGKSGSKKPANKHKRLLKLEKTTKFKQLSIYVRFFHVDFS